ncbi:MAG: DUF4124 domain-containing protein [Thiotrichaceae bacterium]|nr:DUF4124 domain-containing protein [Thiotrichaceae bacterium]
MLKNIKNPVLNIVLISMIIIVSIANTAVARDLPWKDNIYTHYSNQEPLRSFLESLAATENTPIIVSDQIDTTISGYYLNKTSKEIFLDVVKANNLAWYYDGDHLYVSRESQMQTGTVKLTHATATEFTKSLKRLGILDHHYHWVKSDIDRMVYFKGPEQFVSAVLEMSKVLDSKAAKPSIFRWVDKRGVTHFSSELPTEYENNNNVEVIKRDKGLMVLGERDSLGINKQ